jgi:hypothetical protein
MFLKQTTYKPRTGSQSSQGGQEDKKPEAPKTEAAPRKSTDAQPPGGPVSAAAAGRRRVSPVYKHSLIRGRYSGPFPASSFSSRLLVGAIC